MARTITTKITPFALVTFITAINAFALPPVTFNLSFEKNSDGKVSLKGRTNLPDDTIVIVRLESQDNNYSAQDKTRVTTQEFATGFFSNHGSALPSGTYRVEVTVPIAQVQPESLRALFGTHGENLTGPYVKKSEPFPDSNVVQFSQEIQI